MFSQPGFVSPVGADLEYLDALLGDTECEVNVGTDMRWWSPLFYEPGDQLLASFGIEFTERHD
jgi:hypothetical protein